MLICQIKLKINESFTYTNVIYYYLVIIYSYIRLTSQKCYIIIISKLRKYMNFYSKHSSHLFQKMSETLTTILSSRSSSLNEQINLYQKIVNELLKNSLIDQIQTFEQAKLFALQLILLIAQNNDSSLHSVLYWENMMKSNQMVSYFASISNILRSIEQLLIGLQSEQCLNEIKIKNKNKKNHYQGRPQSFCIYRQQLSKMIQSLQSKFRQGAIKNSKTSCLNQQQNEVLIEQLQDLIQKKDIKIKQMASKIDINKTQIDQLQTLLLKLEEKNVQYSDKLEKTQMNFKILESINEETKKQKQELQCINKQLNIQNKKFIQKLQEVDIKKSQKQIGTTNTISSLKGKKTAYEDQNCQQQPVSLKSFRRINKKDTSEEQSLKSQKEPNLVRMLYCQALALQNLL